MDRGVREREGPLAGGPEGTASLGTGEVCPSVRDPDRSVPQVLSVEGRGELAGEGTDRLLDLLPAVHVTGERVVGRPGPGLVRPFGLFSGLAASEGDELPRERAESAHELGGFAAGQVPDGEDPQAAKELLGLRTDSGDGSNGERGEERRRLPGEDQTDTRGLRPVRRDLRDRSGARDADRSGERQLLYE